MVKLSGQSILARHPLAAMGRHGDTLFCVARGRFLPLPAEFAELVAELNFEALTLEALARRHGLAGEELQLICDLLEYLIETGVLTVKKPTAEGDPG